MIIASIFTICVAAAGVYLVAAGTINWVRAWREDFDLSLHVYCALEILIGAVACLSVFYG